MSGRACATDYRALVLEAIATTPNPGATKASVTSDVLQQFSEYTADKVDKMIWQLRKEGLLGRGDMDSTDVEHFFITQAGLDYLKFGTFGRAPTPDHIRPGARRPRKKKGSI